MSPLRHFWSVSFITSLLLGVAAPARALQPLSEFLAGARRDNTDERAALLAAVQQEAEALAALGRTLPVATARGVYTRNEFEAKIDPAEFGVSLPSGLGATTLVIQPYNQFDGYFEVDVPLVDVAGWTRTRAAREGLAAAKSQAHATLLDVEKQVARNYYQLIGAEALRDSARRALDAALEDLALIRVRLGGGVATELDVDRAAAEVERARESISDAELTAELSRRALRTLTGLTPTEDAIAAPDDLREEAPLEQWEGATEELPSLVATIDQRKSAEATALAQRLSLLPKLTAAGLEHLTNAPGFFGANSIWSITLTASWSIDLATFGNARAQEAAAAVAKTKEAGARQAALDQIHEAWFRVHNGIAKGAATRAEATASAAAVHRARERYTQGTSTQLELMQAERDAFAAEVSRIQSDLDLSYARAVLRLAAGRPLDPETTP